MSFEDFLGQVTTEETPIETTPQETQATELSTGTGFDKFLSEPQVSQVGPEVSGINQTDNVDVRQKAPEPMDVYGMPEFTPGSLNAAVDETAQTFKGSGIPTAIAGTAYAYYAGTQGLYSALGYEAGAEEAEKRKEFWSKKAEDYKVQGFETNIIDNPSLALNPLYWNYQVGKMTPMAVGMPIGGVAGSLVGSAVLSAEGTARTYEDVLKETNGDKFAAAGAAATNFALNTVLEAAGLDAILKPVGTIGTRAFKGFLAEGGTEFTQSFSDQVQTTFWEKAAQGYSVPDIVEYIKPKLGGWLKEAAGAGITGGVIGGGISSATGTRTRVPETEQEAMQQLADLGFVDQVEVTQTPELRDKIKELENLPQVELAPITRPNSQEEQVEAPVQDMPTVTTEESTATDVLAETPLRLETEQEAQVREEVAQQPLEGGGGVEGQVTNQEQAVQQQGQAQENIPPAEQGPLPQAATQEVAQQPLTLENPQVTQEVTQEPLTAEQQVAQAQQRMGAGEKVIIPRQETGLSAEQVASLEGIEPPEFSKIDSIAKDITANTGTLVKEVVNSGIVDQVKSKMERITGAPVTSMVEGVTKVGQTTFRNIVKDTIEEERTKIILRGEGVNTSQDNTSITQGNISNTIVPSAPTTSISPETNTEMHNEDGSLEPAPQTAPDLNAPFTPEELKNVEDRQFPGERAEIDRVQDVAPAQISSITKKLGITKRVAELVQPMAEKTYPNSNNLFVAMAAKDRAAVNEAVRQAFEEKVQERADFERRSTVEPSSAVSELENTVGQTEPGKPRKTKEYTQEELNQKAETITEGATSYAQEQDQRSIVDKAFGEGSKIAAAKGRLSKWAQTYVENAAGVLERISPKLYGVVRRFEAKVMDRVKQRQENVREFKEWYSELGKEDKQVVDLAIANYNDAGHRQALKDVIGTDTKALNAWSKVESVIEEIKNEFVAVGLLGAGKDMRYYFPRRVKDLDGLMEYISKDLGKGDALIKELQKITGNPRLSLSEAQAMYRQMLERGYMPGMLMNPGSAKGRTIWSVDNTMVDKFYYSPLEALDSHIREATEAIEQRKVIGTSKLAANQKRLDALNKKLIKSEEDLQVIDSLTKAMAQNEVTSEGEISEWLKTVLENGISIPHQNMAIAALRARFNQKHMTRGFASLKDLSLTSALSQIGSTVTQLSDIAPLINEYGITATLKALSESKVMTKADTDIHTALKDISGSKVTSKALDTVLKYTGFEAVDGFFAGAGMQAAINRGASMSFEDFSKKWENVFTAEELPELYDALKNKNKANPLLREFAFIELANVRPLFPTDMPIGYLEGGNMRLLYALKSWTLKTFNNLIRDTRRVYREKGAVPAAMKLISSVALLSMAGAGADAIRELLMGNEVNFGDKVLDNVLKLFMASRYNIEGLGSGTGFGETMARMFAPPTGFLDKPFFDSLDKIKQSITGDEKDAPKWKTIQEIPAFGKLIWSRFSDAGADRRLSRRRETLFGALKDATLSRDPEDMKRFRELRKEYNTLAKELGQKAITQDSISRAMKRYRKKAIEKKRG